MGAEPLVVLCTCPDDATARGIARAVVEEGLAACANALPGVVSTYRWQGEIHEDREVLLLIKTNATVYEALEARVRALHPYELPEVVAVPIVRGSPAYLTWLLTALTGVTER
jgi:periplasmic divalent cation tolerance protein